MYLYFLLNFALQIKKKLIKIAFKNIKLKKFKLAEYIYNDRRNRIRTCIERCS